MRTYGLGADVVVDTFFPGAYLPGGYVPESPTIIPQDAPPESQSQDGSSEEAGFWSALGQGLTAFGSFSKDAAAAFATGAEGYLTLEEAQALRLGMPVPQRYGTATTRVPGRSSGVSPTTIVVVGLGLLAGGFLLFRARDD